MLRLLYFILLISPSIVIKGMSPDFYKEFGIKYEYIIPFNNKAYELLTNDEKDVLSLANYNNNREAGRAILRKIAKMVTEQLLIERKKTVKVTNEEKMLLTFITMLTEQDPEDKMGRLASEWDEKDQWNNLCFDTFEAKYADYLIRTHENKLSLEPIKVVDPKTAHERALQLLTNEQKNSLKRTSYLADKQKALTTIDCFADLYLNELINNNILPTSTNRQEAKAQFIKAKADALEKAHKS